MNDKLIFSEDLLNKFINQVKNKYPKKSFGYFLSDQDKGQPDSYIIFNDDVRNEMKDEFEQYGNYYKRNQDAGFLTSQEEMYKVHKMISSEGKYIVGVFHSHQRHPAIFSKVDVDLHPSNKLWHLIISLRNFDYPETKVFSLDDGRVRQIPYVVE